MPKVYKHVAKIAFGTRIVKARYLCGSFLTLCTNLCDKNTELAGRTIT